MTQETDSETRFRILICTDGSDESYRGVRYAARLGQGMDADITLLYVRKVDQGMIGGMQVRVARENILEWGLELPGIRYLKKGRDMLVELGQMEEDWDERTTHSDVRGDPLGDHMIEYQNTMGKKIRLRLKVASDILAGVLEQQKDGDHDLIIVGASGRTRNRFDKIFGVTPLALQLAVKAPCSVLVAREIEEGKGHLICVDGSKSSIEAVKRDAMISDRCECPVSLLAVAEDEQRVDHAKDSILEATNALKEVGIKPHKSEIRIGNIVSEIIGEGKHHSVIVLSDSGLGDLERLLSGSTVLRVLEHSETSVMIAR
ncbi:MAG: universal stress protein [Magnetococcales bacterium]|nr:universal stress protein [Magnetococcales bacterium]